MYVLANHGIDKCFICRTAVQGGADRTAATLTAWKGDRLDVSVSLCSDCLDGIVKMALRKEGG